MSIVTMCTASGEQHGLINVLTNSVQFDEFKSMSPEMKEKCKKEKKEDSRIVKARYVNHRGLHERLSKPYCRWAGDPIQQWHLIPGNVYELPMGFIKEVNDSVGMPKRSGLVTVDGSEITKDGSPLANDQKGEKIHELFPISF